MNVCLRCAGLYSLANFYFCISLPLSHFLNPYNVCVPFLMSASSHPCQFTCVVSLPLTFQTAFPPLPSNTRKQAGFSRSFRRSSLQSGVFASCAITTCLSVASIWDMSFESRMNQRNVSSGTSLNQTDCHVFPGQVGSLLRCLLTFSSLLYNPIPLGVWQRAEKKVAEGVGGERHVKTWVKLPGVVLRGRPTLMVQLTQHDFIEFYFYSRSEYFECPRLLNNF